MIVNNLMNFEEGEAGKTIDCYRKKVKQSRNDAKEELKIHNSSSLMIDVNKEWKKFERFWRFEGFDWLLIFHGILGKFFKFRVG
jgi:hypothetical protein